MSGGVPQSMLSPLQPHALVGRDRELAILREHLATTLAGHGSLIPIGGEAGSGKTALAEALDVPLRDLFSEDGDTE
jgi:predicted ATPase